MVIPVTNERFVWRHAAPSTGTGGEFLPGVRAGGQPPRCRTSPADAGSRELLKPMSCLLSYIHPATPTDTSTLMHQKGIMDIKNMLVLGLCVPALALGVAACGDDDETASTGTATQAPAATTAAAAPAAATAEKNIVETAQATPDLSTLVDAVVAADLGETLSGEGPLTVFAPTNDAFAALPPEELQRLLEPANKDELAEILKLHVVAGDVEAADLSDGQKVKTVQGDELEVKIDGDKVMVGDAQVTQPDVATSNGTVHVIDAVLLPKS